MIYTALLAASESLPVVDIDNTIFLQAILFLFLFVVLQSLLFKPWLEVKHKRARTIGGALEQAEVLRVEADEAQADYEARLAKARDAAMTLRSDRRREAETEEAEIVGAARSRANADLDARKAALVEDSEKARAALGGRVAPLANDIVTRVLGRPA